MELPTEFAVRAKLDVNALVKTQPNEIQRLLDSAFFLGRHFRSLEALKFTNQILRFIIPIPSHRSTPVFKADPTHVF